MSSNSRNRRLVIGAALLAALAALVLLMPARKGPTTSPSTDSESSAAGGVDASATKPASGRREEHRLGGDTAQKDAETVEYLREQFGATITNKHTQIKAIEKLLEYLMKNYPSDWQQRIQALLAQAFPGLADQLFAQYQNMTAYNDWLKANRQELNQLSRGDKRDALNDARFRYFGQDAAEIFEESLRHEKIYDAMDSIAENHDLSVDQKLKTYVDSINETYGDEAPSFIDRRQTELLTNFLDLPSVQEDLHAMTDAARAQELDRIRSGLGMDEEALGRWRQLDEERDHAWQSGERYMEQRDQITKGYTGEEQARRLDALRSQTFGAEADTVREEEDSGFFRFGHPRVYGKE